MNCIEQQNPFLRLKHYRPDAVDPQENHATESLAACLVFSQEFRGWFLDFLLGGDGSKFNFTDDYKVVTQEQTDVGILDLLIEREGEFLVVVEIKTKSKEGFQQLDRYQKWVEKNTKNYRYSGLCYLTRGAESSSKGKVRCLTWGQLYGSLSTICSEWNHDTDREIGLQFCRYLENEGIIMRYRVEEISNYGKGWKADDTVISLFEQVYANLDDADESRYTVFKRKGDCPRLEYGLKSWDGIFGRAYNNRVYLYLVVPGIWNKAKPDDRYTFRPLIYLWSNDFKVDWAATQLKLKRWANVIAKHEGFICWVQETKKSDYQEKNLKDIVHQPFEITVGHKEDEINDFEKLSMEELVKKLAEKVKLYVEIVSELK